MSLNSNVPFNAQTMIYLFLRLIPFVMVCFFVLSSVFNKDLVGLIYLCGLLVACFFNIMVGGLFPKGESNEICDLITINNSLLFANLPIGITVVSYTFCYLIYMIIQYDLIYDHMTVFVIFPLILLGDITWNVQHSCFSIINIILSLIIGSSVGIGWSAFLDYAKIKNFHFIKVDNSNRKGKYCGALKEEGKMNCFIYKNGNLLGSLDPNLLGGGNGRGGDGNGGEDDDARRRRRRRWGEKNRHKVKPKKDREESC
jgi:hypothetical protein